MTSPSRDTRPLSALAEDFGTFIINNTDKITEDIRLKNTGIGMAILIASGVRPAAENGDMPFATVQHAGDDQNGVRLSISADDISTQNAILHTLASIPNAVSETPTFEQTGLFTGISLPSSTVATLLNNAKNLISDDPSHIDTIQNQGGFTTEREAALQRNPHNMRGHTISASPSNVDITGLTPGAGIDLSSAFTKAADPKPDPDLTLEGAKDLPQNEKNSQNLTSIGFQFTPI